MFSNDCPQAYLYKRLFLATSFTVDKVRQCTIKKLCRSLRLIQAPQKNRKLSNLVVIAGKLSQVEQHHKRQLARLRNSRWELGCFHKTTACWITHRWCHVWENSVGATDLLPPFSDAHVFIRFYFTLTPDFRYSNLSFVRLSLVESRINLQLTGKISFKLDFKSSLL